jgi:hypothetical protein
MRSGSQYNRHSPTPTQQGSPPLSCDRSEPHAQTSHLRPSQRPPRPQHNMTAVAGSGLPNPTHAMPCIHNHRLILFLHIDGSVLPMHMLRHSGN